MRRSILIFSKHRWRRRRGINIRLRYVSDHNCLEGDGKPLGLKLLLFAITVLKIDPFFPFLWAWAAHLNGSCSISIWITHQLTLCMTLTAPLPLLLLPRWRRVKQWVPLCAGWLETARIRSVWEMSQIHVAWGERCHAKICIGSCDYCAFLPRWKPKMSISSLKCSLKYWSPV